MLYRKLYMNADINKTNTGPANVNGVLEKLQDFQLRSQYCLN